MEAGGRASKSRGKTGERLAARSRLRCHFGWRLNEGKDEDHGEGESTGLACVQPCMYTAWRAADRGSGMVKLADFSKPRTVDYE